MEHQRNRRILALITLVKLKRLDRAKSPRPLLPPYSSRAGRRQIHATRHASSALSNNGKWQGREGHCYSLWSWRSWTFGDPFFHLLDHSLYLFICGAASQVPLEGLSFVKKFATFRIMYPTDKLIQNMIKIVCSRIISIIGLSIDFAWEPSNFKLFCRGRQRNVQRFITHVHSYCFAH